MQVKNMSFSAHADARGIMQLIRTCKPRNVVLVHGEAQKMTILKSRIIREMGIPCFDPPNGMLQHLESSWDVPVRIEDGLLEESLRVLEKLAEQISDEDELLNLVKTRSSAMSEEVGMSGEFGMSEGCGCLSWSTEDAQAGLPPIMQKSKSHISMTTTIDLSIELDALAQKLQKEIMPHAIVSFDGSTIYCKSLKVHLNEHCQAQLDWKFNDSHFAEICLSLIKSSL
jgi:hypothetical protein